MNVVLTVPVPMDSPEVWETFRHMIERWCSTYMQNPPGIQHRLIAACCNADPTPELEQIFAGIPTVFTRVNTEGFDIGSCQAVAKSVTADLVVGTTSRTYFVKPGWLKRLVEASIKFGEGLYGAMASLEANSLIPDKFPNPHLRTAMYGMSSDMWKRYPYLIDNREKGYLFESGEWSITDWASVMGWQVRQVTWDGCYEQHDWPRVKGKFRDNDMSNLLVRDKHTLLFEQSDPAQRMLWRRRAWGN